MSDAIEATSADDDISTASVTRMIDDRLDDQGEIIRPIVADNKPESGRRPFISPSCEIPQP